MLNLSLLDKDVLTFINKNRKQDLPALILKGSPFEKVSVQELAIQIKGLKVAEKKFPGFFKNERILYPQKLNLEQTSSEVTAKYKASLINGSNIADLTGGFGIDSFFLSKSFKNLDYFEINTDLAEVAEHNFKVLRADNIKVRAENAIDFLKNSKTKYDWLYTDPARRDSSGGKVFKLNECEPDIPGNFKILWEHTSNIMIKTSPILDISAGIGELQNVREIHIIAVRNEVKELLWLLGKAENAIPIIKTINYEKTHIQKLEGRIQDNSEKTNYNEPENFLYEPNAAIMKSGLFHALAEKTGTKKLHLNSHLYTSKKLKKFPGRIFQITDIKEFKPVHLKKYFKNKKANISTRNFSESVEELRKRFKIKEGGDLYLFFTTNVNNDKIVIECKKA